MNEENIQVALDTIAGCIDEEMDLLDREERLQVLIQLSLVISELILINEE